MTALEVLHAVRRAGGQLIPNGDKLIMEAPTPLPADVITLVCQHKSALLALLRQEPPALSADGPVQPLSAPTPVTRAVPFWERPGACYACGTTRRWRSTAGVVVCARCHPPADAALVVEWQEEEGF